MTPISILLPTANRPGMLRTALQSVASQTALSNVAEVVVIENLGNRESENICREFPELPINYVYRNPPIPPGYKSAIDAMRYIKSDIMAILFDDDWWMREHLEFALESLVIHTDAVASCCSFYHVTGENGYISAVGNSFVPWFAASSPAVEYRWALRLPDMLVASQIATSFAYSTALVKTEIWTKCLECMANGNPYDTDRLMFVEMGRHGLIVADSRPHVCIRMHQYQEDQRLIASGEAQHWWKVSTKRLLDLATSEGIDLSSEFAVRMSTKNIDLATLQKHCFFNDIDNLIENGIIPQNAAKPRFVQRITPMWKKTYRAITPPILQDWVSTFRASARV